MNKKVHGSYLVFAALNAFIVPVVYFFFPETAGRSLEGKNSHSLNIVAPEAYISADMDVVFALAYNEGVSPVAVSLRKDVPLAGSEEADRILGITNDESSIRELEAGALDRPGNDTKEKRQDA